MSIKANNFINENYKYLRSKCQRFNNIKEFDDILQETILYFLEKDSEFIDGLIDRGEAIRYFMMMFRYNVYSPTSPYQHKYNKIKYCELFSGDAEDKYIYEDEFIDISQVIDESDLFFIDKIIFLYYHRRKYFEPNYSFRKMSIEGDTTQKSLRRRYERVRDYLLKKIIDDYEIKKEK